MVLDSLKENDLKLILVIAWAATVLLPHEVRKTATSEQGCHQGYFNEAPSQLIALASTLNPAAVKATSTCSTRCKKDPYSPDVLPWAPGKDQKPLRVEGLGVEGFWGPR